MSLFFCCVQGQTLEQDFLKDSVMERLKDDEPNVVSSALGLMEVSLVYLLHQKDLIRF